MMSAPKIRLLIVDDSVYMQMALKAIVRLDPGIEIVGMASAGEQAIAMAIELRPDIITMDVNMPGLDGVEATRQIMDRAPTAILMLSSHTERGLAATQRSLEAGAVDYIPKSSSAINVDLATIASEVAAKIRFWGTVRSSVASATSPAPELTPETDLVIMAGGSGSPISVGEVLSKMAKRSVPVLVTLDELKANATTAFIDYLARVTDHTFVEGFHRDTLRTDAITVMPGGRKGIVRRAEDGFRLELQSPGAPSTSSEDLLLTALVGAKSPLLVVLSGRLRDLSSLRAGLGNKKFDLWVQSPETCAVRDLPEAAIALGLPCATLDLSTIGEGLKQLKQAA